MASRTSWIARYLARTPLSPIFLSLSFNEPLDDTYGRLLVLLMLLFPTFVLDLFVAPRSCPLPYGRQECQSYIHPMTINVAYMILLCCRCEKNEKPMPNEEVQ